MTKVIGVISSFLLHKPKYLLSPVTRKCTSYAHLCARGSSLTGPEADSIYSSIYDNFNTLLLRKRVPCSPFNSSLINNFTSQQNKRFSSLALSSSMSRKKRKRESKDTSQNTSHDKRGKIKKNRSHKSEKSVKTDNDWYLVNKKKSKKKKKNSKRNSSPHFPVYSFEAKKRKLNSGGEMSNDKSVDEAHNLLDEAFDGSCQIDSHMGSGSSRNIKVNEANFSKKLNDLLLKDAGEINSHLENYSRNRAFEESVNEHPKDDVRDDAGCQGSWKEYKANLVRDALKTYRKEEWVSGSHGSQQESWQSMGIKYKFKVLSYNVLSQELLVANPRLYRNHNPAHLNWSYRAPGLMDEFKAIDADIICLQEVEFGHRPFFDGLDKLGYKGIHKARTGDKHDGCAIYFKTAKFTLIDYTTVEFEQPEASLLDRCNVGIVVKLHPVGWKDFPLVVSTTHLLYNPRRHDIKLAQMQVLLTEIERFAYNSKFADFTYHPIILTGDFNLQPYTSVYQLLLSGSLRYDILDRKSLRLDGPSHFHLGKSLLPSRLGITDSCQHLKIVKVRELEDVNGFVGSTKVQERLIGIQNSDRNSHVSGIEVPEEDKYRFGSGVLSHGFNFKSVYNHEDSESGEPEATTHHDHWVTVDYMLYTPLENMTNHHHQLELVNRMRLPTVSQCENFIRRIPNEACHSDHLPLVATFHLRVRKTDRDYDDRNTSRKH
ncbi:hypothetical protein LSTR_LSTR008404 [Laodelphax striatellus]|uniref:Endonuclease/exonuclease/phosphatase domain-containing protein n=1 Tax=Laodelphax striatellus TaxID=195883 RepID=A0A482XV67_LAOST|nr:hypothetical protein LSTR_LSTR008404 [Laodelphax striatellus]